MSDFYSDYCNWEKPERGSVYASTSTSKPVRRYILLSLLFLILGLASSLHARHYWVNNAGSPSDGLSHWSSTSDGAPRLTAFGLGEQVLSNAISFRALPRTPHINNPFRAASIDRTGLLNITHPRKDDQLSVLMPTEEPYWLPGEGSGNGDASLAAIRSGEIEDDLFFNICPQKFVTTAPLVELTRASWTSMG